MNNTFNKKLLTLSLLGMLAPATVGMAEDIDIYKASDDAASNPNILIILDNSANWNSNAQHWPDTATCTAQCKQGKAELAALRTVISELDDSINVGLMMFTSGSTDGAYPRYHIRQMTDTNKTAFQTLLGDPAGCTNGTNSVSGTPNCIYQNFNESEASGGEMTNSASTRYSVGMFSAFKYFGGYTSPAHADDNVAGSPTSTSQFGTLRYTDGRYLGDPAAYTDADRTNYNSPLTSDNSCAKNFVIFIGNGYPSQDAAASLLTNVGGDETQLPVPDFTVTPTAQQTLLATSAPGAYTGDAAGQTACQTAAATTYSDTYTSYSCTIASSSSSTADTALADTAYGVYDSVASCEAAETAANAATYDSVTCAISGTAAGETALPDSSCQEFASEAACEAVTTVGGTAYSSVNCTQKAGNCSYTTGTGTQTSSCRADLASCNANAATDFPGSPAWSSRSCGAVVTANCTYAAAATQTFCSDDLTHCGTQASAAGFNAAGLAKSYTNDNCEPDNVAGHKQCDVSGTKNVTTGNTYTITGTATNATGISFSRLGSGAPTYKFSRVGHKTTTTHSHNIYGNYTINTMVSTGTYSGTSSNYADEWARFLNKTDLSAATGQQNAITYAIDVFKDAQDADQTKLLMSMASAGGGKYFSASNEAAIRDALRKIFAEIQSVNSVFASSSLPVSVNTQGTYLNQVFMGMFRPDGSRKPRWVGNLKQYKFWVFADGVMRLSDKNNEEAISSTTGFIAPCADSFWTTDSGDYWNFGSGIAKGNCSAQASAYSSDLKSYYSDAPDGDVVEKGGAAQRLRGVTGATQSSTNYSTRALKTCNGSTTTSCTAFTDFSTSAITAAAGAALLGVPEADAHDLINWTRGQDLLNENDNSSGGVAITNEMRPSVHGGVIHSQPAVVDYGGATGVISFYGADDGVFHAIDGGTTDTEGTELWGFIPPEALGRLNRLKDNGSTTNLIPFPADPVSAASAGDGVRKDYFFDGGTGVYQKSGTVWIFPSMRRGGRAVYAFDVTTPASPTLKWRRGCFTNDTTSTNCYVGWSDIGQTWSKPTLAYLSGYTSGGNPKPVLVFGGGYDQCEDSNTSASSGCGTKGAQVWFVDADTGAIIRTYPTHGSVPGDISLVNDSSGYVQYVYAADTKGYVYRINAGTFDGAISTDAEFVTAGWTSKTSADNIKIAYMSAAGQPRKFLSGPNVVPYAHFNAVLIGSGDREHPLKDSYACGNFSGGVQNQFYMLMDQPDASPALATVLSGDAGPAIGLVDVTTGTSTIALSGATTTITNAAGATSTRGWRFNFGQCEQSVNKPLTIGGVTYFGTNAPTSVTAACQANIGVARGYAVDFETGNPIGAVRSSVFTGGGMPPSPEAGVVEVDGVKMPFIIGAGSHPPPPCDGPDCPPPTPPCSSSALGGCEVEINPTGSRSRVFWYIQAD